MQNEAVDLKMKVRMPGAGPRGEPRVCGHPSAPTPALHSLPGPCKREHLTGGPRNGLKGKGTRGQPPAPARWGARTFNGDRPAGDRVTDAVCLAGDAAKRNRILIQKNQTGGRLRAPCVCGPTRRTTAQELPGGGGGRNGAMPRGWWRRDEGR